MIVAPHKRNYEEAMVVAVKENIRIRLKSYDPKLIDAAAEKIVAIAKRENDKISGPIPFPPRKRSSPSCALSTSTKTAASSLR